MFDFETLDVYQKAKTYNKKVNEFIANSELNRTITRIIHAQQF